MARLESRQQACHLISYPRLRHLDRQGNSLPPDSCTRTIVDVRWYVCLFAPGGACRSADADPDAIPRSSPRSWGWMPMSCQTFGVVLSVTHLHVSKLAPYEKERSEVDRHLGSWICTDPNIAGPSAQDPDGVSLEPEMTAPEISFCQVSRFVGRDGLCLRQR